MTLFDTLKGRKAMTMTIARLEDDNQQLTILLEEAIAKNIDQAAALTRAERTITRLKKQTPVKKATPAKARAK